MKHIYNRTSCKDCGLEYTEDNTPRYERHGKKYVGTRCRECRLKFMRDSEARRRKAAKNIKLAKLKREAALNNLFIFLLGMATNAILLLTYIYFHG